MDFNPAFLLQCMQSDLEHVQGEVKTFAKNQLLESIFKKWVPDPTRELKDTAISAFKTANDVCEGYNFVPSTELDKRIMFLCKDLLACQFHSGFLQSNVLTLDASLGLGHAGPGASRLTKHKDMFHKMFFGKLSTTSIALYKHYITNISPRWRQAELLRSSLYQVDVVQSSKLSTVRKNAKTDRTVETVPSLNMFYQLGAGEIIHGLLQKFHNVDFATQPEINQSMALQGSVAGNFATIDLKEASNYISTGVCQQHFPPQAMTTLNALRSEFTEIEGEDVRLHLMASMGNGFTFPLQTLLFATVVRATYIALGINPVCRGVSRNYAVFGDDIICLSEAYDEVCRQLTLRGLIVNFEKSFNKGPFRESCGGDYFNGHAVRGVYLKEIRNEQDIYSIFNRLSRWSMRRGIDLSSSLRYLKGLAVFQPVPIDSGDTEGFKCPSAVALTGTTDGKTCAKRAGGGYLRYLSSEPVKHYVKLTPAELDYNFHAAIICHIGGYVRRTKCATRVTEPQYKTIRRKSHNWDYVADVGLTIRDYQLLWELL